ncbi:EmrB/QacA subfamily drug resistance transporter [Curtobacterium luteum]|uniref:EmrB/QacA subfamily drug resistance transporter n=1 Tax=Curtobacterium luteum TaxID=33881 RepID=A0A7Y6BBG4_9MICO|nr:MULTISPECIES: DHA2 family efflux MFS transporter permease subunit [Curtobacterium]MBM7802599.1 EmrB/QacA subfamily drug resistance transporter [Curtobacterium luteum]NUU50278.1 DHA2 family efflux MFS transporter permease subunit [Curtobacterium luteum]NUU50405.1 DHA2 family efflux MFS transporter permease subunit [Curtobacterium luteum]GGL06628.1 MFS transporter [Curtobacterium luteum]
MVTPSTTPTPSPDRRRWAGLVVISVAVSLIIVDSTIVNVAIPSIVRDLDIGSTAVQWVQESYTLVFAALLLVFGSLADRLGRRLLMVVGVTVFAAASVLAALAPSGELLVLARIVQGVGGAMVLPTTLSLVNATFTGRERGIAFAVWGSTIGGMVAVGPLLGGWLTTAFSWRWAFGINIPLGVAIVACALVFVRESRDEVHAGRIDVVGAVLSVLASASLVFGLIEGRTYGWWTNAERLRVGDWSWPGALSPIPYAFALTVVAGLLFVVWTRRRQRAGRSTLIALDLFGIASFRGGSVAALIVSLGEFGIILSLPLWLQNVLGYSALQTGFVLLALAVGSFVASGFAATAGQRIGALPIVRLGIAAEIVGVAAVGFVVSSSTPWWAIVPCLFVYGFGVGLATAQLTGVVLQDVPVERSGEASGAQSTARQIGSALGIAVLGTVLFTSTSALVEHRLEDTGTPAATASRVADAVVTSSGGAIAGLRAQDPAVADTAAEAFSDGTRAAAFSAAGFLVLGLAATLRLRRPESETSATPTTDRPVAAG